MKKVMLGAAVCAMAFSANAEDVVVVESARTSAFNSIYAGAGIGGSFLKSDSEARYFDKDGNHQDKMKANRFIGSFVLGGGKVFSNNVYAGAELLMDWGKNKKFEIYDKSKKHTDDFSMKGFIPQIDAKVGYVFKNDALVYGKLGCAWSKVSGYDRSKDETSSKTKASVVLGLGAEKAFCKKFSTALEGDYNFGWKEDGFRFNKGWTVRALVKYNVKY